MFLINRERKRLGFLALLGVFLLVYALAGNSTTTQAQDDPPYIDLVRIFDPESTLPHAAGLAYSPVANILLMLSDLSTGLFGEKASRLTMISPYEELVGSANLLAIANPINLAFDSSANRLFLYDTEGQELRVIKADSNGMPDFSAMSSFEAQPFGVQNPQGMAVDPVSGALFILSEADSRIVRIQPDAQGGFDGAAALAEGRISHIDLSGRGLGSLRGLAFHPGNAHLHVLNPGQRKLFEFSETGQLLATRDMSVLDLGYRDPQGIVFAPSADLTDDPAEMHLYLMDSGMGPLTSGLMLSENLYLPLLVMQAQTVQSLAPGAVEAGAAEQGPARIMEFTLTRPAGIPHP